MKFKLKTNNNEKLNEAYQLAVKYVDEINKKDVIGIAFLGAIVRGYYDNDSDIDITIFRKKYRQKITSDTFDYHGYQLHIFDVDYKNELAIKWEMGKRWAYSTSQVYWEKSNLITSLIENKTSISESEKKWFLMSGITLSEWYINRLTDLWIRRGDIENAHYQFSEGLTHFFNALFALNNELVPDYKWRIFCSKQLETLPPNYSEDISNIQIVHSITVEEIERRKKVFFNMWNSILPKIEDKLGMKYEEFKDKV
ncbi:hypothetical protein K7J14_15520 [Treponema zuelzerae]|uniref:Polymerase nucleotidyl transferase domain-containing protein n=1 Tax=Teretinema zuelzerae TaxID=156 RepID=A0AAE3EJW9_9SPIR|nr:hypothetical protein [Teretinema zuelzerae]MCD1656109.1 hypothetical protein [Teretinema zuelzerae]